MVIEWLKFRIQPEFREVFIQKDTAIWTAALSQYPGFLGKEVWLNPHKLDELILVIHWETREDWAAIPMTFLFQVEQAFAKEMGKDNYQLVETGEYQVL